MRNSSQTTSPSDRGVTLVELLIVVVLTGILMPAIAAVFITIVRNSPSVQTRADDSRTTRGLSTWLPQDVLSTPPSIIIDGSSTPGYTVNPLRVSDCGPAAAGTNVLHMVWTENAGTLMTYVANYRFITTGTTTQIKRYTCSRSGSAPFGNTREFNVTTPIVQTTSASATPILASGTLQFIEVKATTVSGVEVLIRAASRNPAEQLPNP